MAVVVIETTAPEGGGLIQAQIDGDEAAGEVEVPEGTHALSWFVFGAPGTRYTVSITSPEDLAFKHEAKLKNEQRDAGLHWFTV